MPPSTSQPAPITLTPTEISIALRAALASRQPICIHGPVGIGKSQTVAQAVQNIPGATWQLEPTSRRDPTDYSGIPMPDTATRTTVWCEPAFLVNAREQALAHPTIPHVIFWDEFNRAAPSVQNVAMSFILDNRSGEFVLPPNVCHALAINDANDSSMVTAMSEAGRNRVVHVYQRADTDAWLLWATGRLPADRASAKGPQAGACAATCEPFAFDNYVDTVTGRVRPEVIAFFDNHPDALHVFDRHADAFPTPRSWEFVSRILNPALPPTVERALICGAVGVPYGTQFWSHLQTIRTLAGRYSVKDILANPTTAAVPTEVSALVMVTNGLSLRIDATNATAALTWLARVPNEYAAFAILGAIRRTGNEASPLHAVAAVNAWKLAHQDMF